MKQLLVVAGDRALTKFVAETLLGRKVTATDPSMEGNGWHISRAHTGLEALLLVTKSDKRFDAIVLDQHLPDRDVLLVLDELRSYKGSEDLPIFVMSERGRDQLTRRLASDTYYVSGFIDKPVTSESLRRGLRNLRRMRLVLLVDEDQARMAEFTKALRQAGYAVDSARSSRSALKAVANMRPDAVVSALKLKESSGTDLCVRLKRQAETHAIPVVLHGDLADIEDSEIEENAHRADDFVGPELTGDILVERLSTLVGRGSSMVSSLPPPMPAGADPMSTQPLIDRKAVLRAVGSETLEAQDPAWDSTKTPAGTDEQDPTDVDLASTRPPGALTSLPPASASPSNRSSSTKRSNRRVPCNLSVSIREGETIYQSKTLNISDGGILITTDHPLEIGTRIDLTLELPNTERPIVAVGKVAWFGSAPSMPEGTHKAGVGVKFSRIDPKDLQLIVDYVNRLSKVVYVAP